ncbi:aminomethyl-transferring glycine dehydrogenase subunit GcvPA [Alkaliphilus transvaalensis]|uniref:aminomethyl-transferring glycine dehydrogenase subunit GcvPA n=1 Tax=Alkaliphilus transvaalensis TaxID=114628 RepID=UPI0004797C8A|nr:aminomethyl-transferring glycine dehydrogenase subunit GcvPA [Alkaliphilus transvaalensis]
MYPYIPSTEKTKKQMLEEIGHKDISELFDDIDDNIKLKGPLNLPKHKSELEVSRYIKGLSETNESLDRYTSFLGCGAYDHYIPSPIKHIISRSEFATAYTPYQPEISQGTLQTIFEFQSMMCGLTGMDVCNASVYDGSTAVYEAAHVALAENRRKEILISKSVHPEYRKVLKGSLESAKVKYTEIDLEGGVTSLDDLKSKLNNDVSAVIFQSPNFLGFIENSEEIVNLAHQNKTLAVMSTDPISLGLLKTPAEIGVDIAIGEAQSLGIPVSFGGPYLGFVTTNKKLIRKVPGRIAGMTKDLDGKTGFVLTLQTREQHIRREKSISNICTNQALNATAATIYMALLGKDGMKEMAKVNYNNAHYAYEKLLETGVFEDPFKKSFFKEFTLVSKVDINKINDELWKNKIIGGFNSTSIYPELGNICTFAVTEKRTKEEIDKLCSIIREVQ